MVTHLPAPGPAAGPGAGPTRPPLPVDALDAVLREQRAAGRLPSLAVGVGCDGRLGWFGGAGSLDGRGGTSLPAGARATPGPSTQYRIGSITKTVVAVLVLRARDAGELRLTDPLDRFVPGTSLGDATLLQLLTHTSGLRAETDGAWWERSPGRSWESIAGGIGRTHAPGQRFHYSNTGFAALGQVVEKVCGTSWFDAARAQVLEPLGMARTSLEPLDDDHARGLAVHPRADLLHAEPHTVTGAMAPAGQLWSTVADLLAYSRVLLGQAPDVLAPATAAEMAVPVAAAPDPGQPLTCAWGLGVSVHWAGARTTVGHGGSMPGFLAGLRVDRETGEAVVGFANATSGWPGPMPYLEAVRAAAAAGGSRVVGCDDERAGVGGEGAGGEGAGVPADVLGEWWWGTNGFVLRVDGGVARLDTVAGGRGTRLRRGTPADLDRAAPTNRPDGVEAFWVGEGGYFDGEVLRVVRGDGVTWLDLGSFTLTRTPYDPAAFLPGGHDPAGWY